MNECLNCGKSVKNKYCNVSCQNKHQNKIKCDKKYGAFKKFKVLCNNCGVEFEAEEREKLFPKKDKYYCSRSCANSRNWNEEDKEIKSKSLKGKKYVKRQISFCKKCGKEIEHLPSIERKYCTKCRPSNSKKNRVISFCKKCGKEIEHIPSIKRKYCSVKCANEVSNKNLEKARKGGIKSSNNQNKRSKNEIHFAELCKTEFKKVLTNEAIFNGWDADVIIEDLKIAILWNGVWHYKKITEEHSLNQVQNRDKMKLKEIEKAGYKSYVIKDMGKHNKDFVNSEFEKFKRHCGLEKW